MSDHLKNDALSRRGFLEMGSVALAAAGVLSATAAAQEQHAYPVKGDRSSSAPGPGNPPIDGQNPDSFLPPSSDAGGVQTFKYPFALSHKRMQEGGWSREVTIRELPVSKSIAGVDMRLTAGGVRELHWHTAAEWSIVLYGSARITAVDLDGKSFVADVNEGDLWYFPRAFPIPFKDWVPTAPNSFWYSTMATSPNTKPSYSPIGWPIPHDVLAANFGVSEQAMEKMPRKEKFIFQTAVPGPLADDQRIAAGSLGKSPYDFVFREAQMPITKNTKGGKVQIIDSSRFKVSTTIAAAIVTVHAGGMRELHWHPNADEWQYFISGSGRMTVFATGGRARTMDFLPETSAISRGRCHTMSKTQAIPT